MGGVAGGIIKRIDGGRASKLWEAAKFANGEWPCCVALPAVCAWNDVIVEPGQWVVLTWKSVRVDIKFVVDFQGEVVVLDRTEVIHGEKITWIRSGNLVRSPALVQVEIKTT